MRILRSFASISALSLALVTLSGRHEVAGQSVGIGAVVGTITSCVASKDAVSLDVLSSGKAVHVTVSEKDLLPWPSPDYRTVLGSPYRIAGDCPSSGERVRITHCTGCQAPTVDAIEVLDGSESFEEGRPRLWLIRQFFDRTATRANEYDHLFISSMVLAHLNQQDDGRRSLWIRGRLGQELDAYSSDGRAAYMIGKLGSSEIAGDLRLVRTIYNQHRSEIGLVKGLPYRAGEHGMSPFVGAWGTFPLAISLENTNGTLVPLYDQGFPKPR